MNSTEYNNHHLETTEFVEGGLGRSASTQAKFQLAALAVTLTIAILGGSITGIVLRTPLFEQIDDVERMFDDEPYWKTPSDFEIVIGQDEDHHSGNKVKLRRKIKDSCEQEPSTVKAVSIQMKPE